MPETEQMSRRVGLIGVGAMGKALLTRLRAAGMSVHAYDPSEAARDAARAGGATVADSPAEGARDVRYVHVIVASDDQVIDALLGRDGVLAAASPGTIVFLHSTILPATTRQVAEAGARLVVDVFDAPITSVPSELEAGRAAFLLGGPDALIDASRDYLRTLGDTVYHFGPLGAGNVAKLAKALINAGERVVLAEALELVAAGGLDLRTFLAMERATGTDSPVSRWEKIFAIQDGKARHRPSTNLFNKDIMLAAKLAESCGLKMPVTKGTARTAAQWIKQWRTLSKAT